jgi:hypothetical protein
MRFRKREYRINVLKWNRGNPVFFCRITCIQTPISSKWRDDTILFYDHYLGKPSQSYKVFAASIADGYVRMALDELIYLLKHLFALSQNLIKFPLNGRNLVPFLVKPFSLCFLKSDVTPLQDLELTFLT